MAKMTEEQKAANKVASAERAAAYRARSREYNAAIKAAEAEVMLSPEYAARMAAFKALEDSIDTRDAALKAIDDEIAALQEKRLAVQQVHSKLISEKKVLRDTTFKCSEQVQEKLVGAVKERYPDMVNVWSAAQWVRPEGI